MIWIGRGRHEHKPWPVPYFTRMDQGGAMSTSEEQKRRDIITQYTDEKWRDELFISPEDVAKGEEADKKLPLWVKLLDSNMLTFVVLPLLLWIGIYIYATPLPQAKAAQIAGMWFWGTGILASGCGFFWALASGEYASRRGRRLYFDGYKKLYKTYRAETGLCRFLTWVSLVLSLPFRFGLGSFLAVGIPFWWHFSN